MIQKKTSKYVLKQLVDSLISQQKLIVNFNKMATIHLFQLLKCEDLLLFSVLYYCKLNVFGVWTQKVT